MREPNRWHFAHRSILGRNRDTGEIYINISRVLLPDHHCPSLQSIDSGPWCNMYFLHSIFDTTHPPRLILVRLVLPCISIPVCDTDTVPVNNWLMHSCRNIPEPSKLCFFLHATACALTAVSRFNTMPLQFLTPNLLHIMQCQVSGIWRLWAVVPLGISRLIQKDALFNAHH